MLKIVVALDNGIITEHFGHCDNFMIFDTENNQIIKSETIESRTQTPVFTHFLADLGAKCRDQRRYGRRRC